LDSFLAAITAIICTAAIVVFVVTVAIPLVIREFASPWAALGVFTLAFLAVLPRKFSVLDGSETAISAVELAATVVIFVVTVSIPFVVREFASTVTGCTAAVGGVQAFARFAIFGQNFTTLDGFLTTISAVVLASTVVVFVITIAIPFVVRELARAFAVTVALVFRVQTFALLAILCTD